MFLYSYISVLKKTLFVWLCWSKNLIHPDLLMTVIMDPLNNNQLPMVFLWKWGSKSPPTLNFEFWMLLRVFFRGVVGGGLKFKTSSDHEPVVTSYTGQNRLKSETEMPSYYSYFNSETSSSVEFDSSSSSSNNSYTIYDPKDAIIWVTFHWLPCQTEANLLDWLEHNKPSKISIKDVVSWICIKKFWIKFYKESYI